jgi:hypothetical protein
MKRSVLTTSKKNIAIIKGKSQENNELFHNTKDYNHIKGK